MSKFLFLVLEIAISLAISSERRASLTPFLPSSSLLFPKNSVYPFFPQPFSFSPPPPLSPHPRTMQTSTLARRAARDVSANVFKKKAKVAAKAKTAAPKRSSSSSGEEGLWLPNTARPEWLDGSLPGDRGFDPLGLAKPTEYIQVRGGERRGEGGGERERGIIWV